MDETQKPPTWFWIIVGVALLWNMLGVMIFFAQILTEPEIIAALPEAERTLYQNIPIWAYIAFAVAVFCGIFGCVALAMRKGWAVLMFKLSLIGVIVQNVNALFVQDSFAVFDLGSTIMVTLVVVGAIALLWFSIRARNFPYVQETMAGLADKSVPSINNWREPLYTYEHPVSHI